MVLENAGSLLEVINNIQALKKSMPDAAILQKDNSGNSYWIALLSHAKTDDPLKDVRADWILDSGCSKHTTGNLKLCEDIEFSNGGSVSGVSGALIIQGS